MPAKPHTVLIADDHPVVRSGVRLLLRTEADFALVGETSDAVATFAAAEQHRPALLVLDLWLGGNDGFELIRQLRAAIPETRVLIYSMNDEIAYGPRALRAGAAGYVMKDSDLGALLGALRTVANGQRYMSPALAEELAESALRMLKGAAEGRPAAFAGLTDRELQVLRLIGCGQPSAAIAEALKISPKTVNAHRENLKNKLRLTNAAELAQRAATLVKNRRL